MSTTNMKLYREFGENVRRIRGISGMTQDRVAQKLGISRSSLANVESGRQRVLLHEVFRYAKALKTDTNNLLTGLGDTKFDKAWRLYIEELDGVE